MINCTDLSVCACVCVCVFVCACRFVAMKAREAQRKRTKGGTWASPHGVDGSRGSVILTLDDTSPRERPESAAESLGSRSGARPWTSLGIRDKSAGKALLGRNRSWTASSEDHASREGM